MLPEVTTMPLEFLRPLWLLGLVVVCLFSFIRYKKGNHSAQQSLIAAHLSANVITNTTRQTGKRQLTFSLMGAIACIALAGPTWRNIDMPVYELDKAQVIAFDLSYSMYATDIKPNRLTQARFKAIDLIKQWSEGEKALVAYAGDAFTIAPLTRDGNAIINHIPNLSPDIMPVAGSRADIALEKAITLLKNAGYNQGHIVFISDGISAEQAEQMVEQLAGTKWVVSILAVATHHGAPITLNDGSLLKDDAGNIVLPSLNPQPFYDIIKASDGLYQTTRSDSTDIKQLGSYFNDKQNRKSEAEQAGAEMFAIDDGYWLSFILLPLFLLLFRKGALFAVLLMLYLPLGSPSVEAASSSIWKNDQQNAFQAYQAQDYQRASELYDTPFERGSALYKQGDYQQALSAFNLATEAQPENANAFYNKGNSYAQLQQFEEAIAAYDHALSLNPDFQAAADNKALLEKTQAQQEQDQQEQQNSEQQDDQQSQQDQQNSDQQEDQQSQQDQQNSEQQDDQQSQQDQQNSEQQDGQQSQQQNSEQQDAQQSQQDQQNSEQQSQQESEAKDSEQASQLAQDEQAPSEKTQQAAQLQQGEVEPNQELQALPNWLKNMPDDPSILLRSKMQLEYQKRAQSQPVKQQSNNGVIW